MSSSSGKTGKTAIPLLYTQLPVVKAITLVNQASVQSYTELCQLLWTVYILLSCSLCVLEEVWKKMRKVPTRLYVPISPNTPVIVTQMHVAR